MVKECAAVKVILQGKLRLQDINGVIQSGYLWMTFQ